jgi:hypothetical protein
MTDPTARFDSIIGKIEGELERLAILRDDLGGASTTAHRRACETAFWALVTIFKHGEMYDEGRPTELQRWEPRLAEARDALAASLGRDAHGDPLPAKGTP